MGFDINTGTRYTVIGYGSWATALVKILSDKQQEPVGWYVAKDDVAQYIREKGRNPRYLRDVKFTADSLRVYSSLDVAVEGSDVLVLAVPSAYLKVTLEDLHTPLRDKFVISAIKGIIPGEFQTVTEFINDAYGVPYDRLGVVTGPCHSEEIALERLSYLTMVTKCMGTSEALCERFSTDYLRMNPSQDIYGAEYASVLKNIYAVCAGFAIGLGYGDNFLAVLVSNASMEMSRFISESYPFGRNLNASAYLGDLLVTCYSQFSRNRTFGVMLGKGYNINSAMAEMNMVAEGYFASACLRHVNKRFGISMPIADCVHKVLYEGGCVAEQMRSLTYKLI